MVVYIAHKTNIKFVDLKTFYMARDAHNIPLQENGYKISIKIAFIYGENNSSSQPEFDEWQTKNENENPSGSRRRNVFRHDDWQLFFGELVLILFIKNIQSQCKNDARFVMAPNEIASMRFHRSVVYKVRLSVFDTQHLRSGSFPGTGLRTDGVVQTFVFIDDLSTRDDGLMDTVVMCICLCAPPLVPFCYVPGNN